MYPESILRLLHNYSFLINIITKIIRSDQNTPDMNIMKKEIISDKLFQGLNKFQIWRF